MVPDKEKRHKLIIRTTSWMSDEKYLKLLYRSICKKKLPLDSPVTFNEKLQWYKLNYKDPLMTICADKYEVRKYVSNTGYSNLLVPLINVYDSAEDINFDTLPPKCVFKCTHNSSGNMKWDVNKQNDIKKIRKTFREMLSINAFWLAREWAYKDIKARIICEKLIEAETPIIDIKFLCFYGEPYFIYYDIGMNDEEGKHAIGRRAVLNKDFSALDIKTSMHKLDRSEVVKPNNYNELLVAVRKLAKPFPHVRVDFFCADGVIYFSELTFYSGGGFSKFEPDSWDKTIGDCFKLPLESSYEI